MGWLKRIFRAVVSVVNRAVDPIVQIISDANSWLGNKISDLKNDII